MDQRRHHHQPPLQMADVFGDPEMATALLDRPTYHLFFVETGNDSFRLRPSSAAHKHGRKNQQLAPQPALRDISWARVISMKPGISSQCKSTCRATLQVEPCVSSNAIFLSFEFDCLSRQASQIKRGAKPRGPRSPEAEVRAFRRPISVQSGCNPFRPGNRHRTGRAHRSGTD